jgi:hypothetical protein
MLSVYNLAEMGNIGMCEIVNVVAVVIDLIFFLILTLWIAGLISICVDNQG